MNADANLISRSFATDSNGVQTATETKNPIPVEIHSLTRDEFFRAGEQKLNAEMMVTTAAINYSNQELIEIDSVKYAIYRKYRDSNSDDIELYLRKEVGS